MFSDQSVAFYISWIQFLLHLYIYYHILLDPDIVNDSDSDTTAYELNKCLIVLYMFVNFSFVYDTVLALCFVFNLRIIFHWPSGT